MSLADALSDLVEDRRNGRDTSIELIASDYGINPKLLERKFNESFPNGVTKFESANDALKRRIASTVDKLCKNYNVPVNETKVVNARGITYTVICFLQGAKKRKYLAVSHVDGSAYRTSL